MKRSSMTMALVVLLGAVISHSDLYGDFGYLQGVTEYYNSFNDGTGVEFGISVSSTFIKPNNGIYQGETRVNYTYEIPDLSAYSHLTSGGNYFQTFCIQTQECVELGVTYTSQLNLEGDSSGAYSTTLGLGAQAVTEGTALLYRLFATGALANYDYNYGTGRADDALILQEAFWKLQSQTTETIGALTAADWSGNKYLAALKATDSSKDWLQTYDPSRDSSGYAVLAMQNIDSKLVGAQDFLFLVRTTTGDDVPEPGTVCLWLTAVGRAFVWRRRNQRKNA